MSTVGTVIVIGNGPAGMRFAHELLKREPQARVLVFGNEPYQPYNRVQLSALLAGEIAYDDILSVLPEKTVNTGLEFIYSAISAIDPSQKSVRDSNGEHYHYDHLVIATGSNPHIPNIPGVELTGVYTFRNLKDAEALYGRVARARHIVIVGGGLLGLEAARALQRAHTMVTVIQQAPRLMNRQLDEQASALLTEAVTRLGIKVITESGVRKIEGNQRVAAVTLRTGESILCDTVVLCAGIKPEISLARDANIKINNGIVVNDKLQTNIPNVFAIGECCEHLGVVYGLVNPGFEQAAIAANVIAQGDAQYKGSLEVSRLKVVGQTVCSMGTPCNELRRPLVRELTYYHKKTRTYRKILLHRGIIEGAVGFNEWPELRRVQEAYQFQRRIYPWQYFRFRLFGRLFADENDSVKNWPSSTVVCHCNNITQGQLVDQIAKGITRCDELQKATSAGTVCGSCKPLLQNLLGQKETLEKDSHAIGLALSSLISIALVFILFFMPALSPSASVLNSTPFEWLWNDKFYKQVTGFCMLGLTLLGLLFSVRKKLKGTFLGAFSHWRFAHALLSFAAGLMIIAHTGLNLGSNLNLWLVVNFLMAIAAGSATALVIAASHLIKPSLSQSLRKGVRWTHILITWPLPILIFTHILSVYYF
jgi:nitrite reductase (NADH) large subunit